MADPGGPHLTAALTCERVLQEADGVVSAIRLIDRVIFLAEPDGSLVAAQHPFTFLLSFKSGSARGRFKIRVRVEKPSGEDAPLLEAPVFFEGEERGVNVVVQALFEPDQEGLYWYDVFFEDTRVTRMPLRAIFQPRPIAGPPG